MTDDAGESPGWVNPSGRTGAASGAGSPPPAPAAGPPRPGGSPPVNPFAPPPAFAPPGWAPGPKRPRGFWFAAPALVAAVAVGLFVAVLVAQAPRLRAAGDGEQVGSPEGGVELKLAEKQQYFVFQVGEPSTDINPSCSIRTAGRTAPLALGSPRSGDDWTDDESQDWWLVGSFTLPEGAAASDGLLLCQGLSERMLVRPDDSPVAWLGGGVLVLLGGMFVAVGLTVLLVVLRHRSTRPPVPRSQPAAYAAYGAAWPGPWPPPSQPSGPPQVPPQGPQQGPQQGPPNQGW